MLVNFKSYRIYLVKLKAMAIRIKMLKVFYFNKRKIKMINKIIKRKRIQQQAPIIAKLLLKNRNPITPLQWIT